MKENIYKYEKFRVPLKTADGSVHCAVGGVSTPVILRGEEKFIKFLIIPNLSQNLYLGVDFVRTFGLVKDLFDESKVGINSLSNSVLGIDDNFHVLNATQRKSLERAIQSFPSYSSEGLGRTSLVIHVIDTSNAKPIKQRHFSVSPAVGKLLYAEINRMIDVGVVEESPWSSPVALVRKPGKVRLCLDARKVNSVTVKDAYPLPLIDGILSRLRKASLDLKDAFWQIPLEESSKEKTAFTVPGRPLYPFVTMRFELCNAPQTMCRLMDKVIPSHLRTKVFVYLDDLLLITEEFDEHITLLQEIDVQMRKASFTLNIEKSKFLLKKVKYLGHIIGHGTITTDPDTVKAVQEYPLPNSVRQLIRFLGICGWYRIFVRDFATLTSPLTDALQKKRKFIWSDEAKDAFNKLKTSLCSAPVLHNPDFTRPFSYES